METVWGLVGMATYIVAVITLAAGVTWVIVKLSPAPKEAAASHAPEAKVKNSQRTKH